MNIRLTKLRGVMAESSLDAVWITTAENHLYFCGFDNPDGQLLITKENAYVFADFRYIEAAKREAFPECTVIMPKGSRKDYLLPLLEENGVHTVGYEDLYLSCHSYDRLKADLAGYETAPLGSSLDMLRCVKSEEEIQCIIRAQRIAEDALAALLKNITYDMTEIEVAAELEYHMKKNGSQKPSFDTIAVSGSASSSPHGVPRNVKLEKGFLTMDFGAVVDGYHSDMTRTIVIGKADEEIARLYNTVLAAQCAAIDAITEGAKNADMDKVARDLIDNAGYQGRFGHSLGHGVGLEIHEQPGVSGGMGDATLKVGQIITVEPGIYIEGKYGCRIEDMVLITKGGKRNLTNCPKEMIEI